MHLSTVRIAWRNLGRNRRRTCLAMGAIALAQFVLVFVNGLMAGSFSSLQDTLTGPFVGHVQIHQKDWREERAPDLFISHLARTRSEIEAIPGVMQVLPRLYSAALAAAGEKTAEPAEAGMAMVVGVDVAAEAGPGGLLDHVDAADLPGKGEVLVGRVLANRLKVAPGQLLAVIGQDAYGFPASDLYGIKGILRTNVDIVKQSGIVMNLPDAADLLSMPDEAHEIIVHGTNYAMAEELAGRIRALPGLADAEVLPWREAAPQLSRMLDLKNLVDVIFVAIVFVAAAAGVTNTSMMSTFERQHEFGMLLALGTRPRRLVEMVILESVVLGLIGVAAGAVLGWAAVTVTGYTGINYAALSGVHAEDVSYGGVSFPYVIYPVFELRHVVFGLVAVTITSVVASVWPSLLAARLEPVEALRS
jgi:putative ABC transport system permease protein